MKKISWNANYWFLLIFVGIYYFFRLPLFGTGWDGQDGSGHDLYIFLNHPVGPNYLLESRIFGVNQYGIPQHPAFPYEMISWLGYGYQKIVDYKNFSYGQIISHVKFIVATVQLLFYCLIISIMLRHLNSNKSRMTALFWIVLLAITPLSINNSNEFQIDSFIGFSMIAIYCLVLVSFSLRILGNRVSITLIFFASVFLGLGKTEWTILLNASFAFTGFYIFYLNLLNRNPYLLDGSFSLLISALLGCMLGNFLSYIIDPINYLAGWELVSRVSDSSTIFSNNGFANFLQAFQQRSIFLWAPIGLIFYGAYSILIRPLSVTFFQSYAVSTTLFFGYFFATWGGDIPRYFSPAFIALIITSAGIYVFNQDIKKSFSFNMCSIAFACVLLLISYRYISSPSLIDRHQHGISQRGYDPKCLYHIPIEDLHHSDANFVAFGISSDDAALLAKKNGLILCK